MKIPKVTKSCIWCWACVSIAPETFTLNNQWLAQTIEADSYENPNIADAISVCPVGAIIWTETEEKIEEITKKMNALRKPVVDKKCIWCWACIAISPDVFDFSDEWLAIAKELDNYEGKWVDDSISACPVSAISWE